MYAYLGTVGTVSAQPGPEPPPAPFVVEHAEDEDEKEAPIEGEFIASSIFQGATAIVRLWSPLTLESHYFGVEENDVGMVGFAWTFSRGHFRFIPGLAWSFSSHGPPAPVVTARWTYEGRRWITQGLWVQSLRAYVPEKEGEDEPENIRHASILDGIHASAVLGRVELGPLVEHIRYREENSWKGGVRAAWRLPRGFKLVTQIVGPGTEVRGGLAWEP